jgi:hypothetical protein
MCRGKGLSSCQVLAGLSFSLCNFDEPTAENVWRTLAFLEIP